MNAERAIGIFTVFVFMWAVSSWVSPDVRAWVTAGEPVNVAQR